VLKIGATLEPLLGPDKFRVSASMDVDFTSGDQSEETFDPNKSVMVTAQKTEDISGGTLQAGVPGTASNLPRPPARPAGSATGATRKTENISYQTSRTIKRTRIPQGAVKRMSLAVLVDHNVRWEGAGAKAKRIVEAPSPERLKTIRDLVAAATGFSETRGDQLTVETLAFESTSGAEPPSELAVPPAPKNNLPPWLQKYVKDMPAGLLIGIGIGAALILIVPIVLLAMRRSRAPAARPGMDKAIEGEADGLAAFEGQMASRAATQERLDAEALLALKSSPPGTKKSEILSKHLKKSVKHDPVVSAQLLRTWMEETEI
jgi:flagellar M-ring protein FliF